MSEKQQKIADKLLTNISNALTYSDNCEAVSAYKEFLVAVDISKNIDYRTARGE